MDKVCRMAEWKIRFYNFMTNNNCERLEEIPLEILDFLNAYTYKELIKPFARLDLQKGSNRGDLQKKYIINEGVALSLCRQLGHSKRYPKKSKSLALALASLSEGQPPEKF